MNGMTAPVDTPLFYQTIIDTGINPYTGPATTVTEETRNAIVTHASRAPRPGQKPTTRKKRK